MSRSSWEEPLGAAGPVTRLLAQDHERLDALLRRALAPPGEAVDHDAFEAFRHGLLRHIAMEEKVLFPDALKRRGGEPLPVVRQLRMDHAALGTLMVPPPTRDLVETVARILDSHNPLEEGPEGLYAACEALAGAEGEALAERMRAVPPVKVAAHFDSPRVREHLEALLRARERGPA